MAIASGMLLDLDQGSMTVWKNDVKLGVMMPERLGRVRWTRTPLCWAADLCSAEGLSCRIESALGPASPTEEELEAAKDFERWGWYTDSDDQSDDSDDDE